MGVHESTMRPPVADLVPATRRGAGYGTSPGSTLALLAFPDIARTRAAPPGAILTPAEIRPALQSASATTPAPPT